MSDQITNLVIGHVATNFDKAGKIIGAEFWPLMKIAADENLLLQFQNMQISTPLPLRIRQAGEILISRFFSQATAVELADQERYFIDSEVVECTKYPSGSVKQCVVQFFLRNR